MIDWDFVHTMGKHVGFTNREVFLSRFEQSSDGCWLWTGVPSSRGYGQFFAQGVYYTAHKASYLYFIGELEDGKCLRHSCDTPLCVNPAHLRPGTQLENMQDKYFRNRAHHVKGERVKHSKLNERDVRAIRAAHLLGAEVKYQAEAYNVTVATIYQIVEQRTWKYI